MIAFLLAASLFGSDHPLLASRLADVPDGDASGSSAQSAPPAPSLDFDLLGDQGKQQVDPKALELQKKLSS